MSDRPSDELPAIPPAKGIARSLASARPGQTLLVDASGNVTSPSSLAAFSGIGHIVLWIAPLFVVSGVVVLVMGWLGHLAGVLAVLVVSYLLVLRWLGRFGDIGRAMERSASDPLEARRIALGVAESWSMPRAIRANARMIAGGATWLHGELPEALALTQRALVELPATGMFQPIHVLARINEIQLLAITGERARARERLAELARQGPLTGDLVRLQWIDTQLVVAFEDGDPSSLPDDLDAWARDLLDTNKFGSTLVLLAWALRQRGQLDLVPVLLDVARDRLPECHLDAAHPRLAAWYRAAA